MGGWTKKSQTTLHSILIPPDPPKPLNLTFTGPNDNSDCVVIEPPEFLTEETESYSCHKTTQEKIKHATKIKKKRRHSRHNKNTGEKDKRENKKIVCPVSTTGETESKRSTTLKQGGMEQVITTNTMTGTLPRAKVAGTILYLRDYTTGSIFTSRGYMDL